MSSRIASRSPLTVALRLALVVVFALAAFAPLASAEIENVQPAAKSPNGVYIVQLAEPPVVMYTGGIRGLRATAVAEGNRPDPNNSDVRAYTAFLEGRHGAVLRALGAADKLYSYTFVYNGFAARMTPMQAARAVAQPGVISVTPDTIVYADTVSTPAFLGLDQPGGIWDQLGGVSRAGDGVIIGVIDSGIWPESASFADDGNFRVLPRWRGGCVEGEEWDASLCNNKLIGAKYYNAGMGGNAGIDANRPWEFNSARDYNAHGTHTASTSGGNHNVEASAQGNLLGYASGMAPRARIAAYKALWSTVDASTASGTTSDLVAAINDATRDGVNVINYSISGSQTSVVDPAEQAFLVAAGAGVFVAASAGNSGPTASTVAHNSPWLTTVAAGTHDRGYSATVTLGNDAVYEGISLGSGAGPAPLVLSTVVGLDGADPTAVRLCISGTLDPAKATGKIVLCDRGTNARVDKSLAVQLAGGIGMVLANVSPSSLNADIHFVPTVHVDHVVGAAIKAYIAADPAAATATLSAGQQVQVEAPFVASFSSRGPALAISGNLLKPDIMAPGVDIIAATSPSTTGYNFNFMSGTSMSAPHIAGIAALLKARQPAWTPSMIKSAMMTTASQVTNAGNPLSASGNPFGYGAGQVNPNAAINPGVVYLTRMQDYAGFLCGQGLGAVLPNPKVCALRNIGASDLNLPSIAIGSLAGMQTVKRSVYNVTSTTLVLDAAGSVPGVAVEVTPAQIVVKPGTSTSFEVKLTRTDATLGAYTFGELVLTGGGFTVRSPIAVRPVAVSAPVQVVGAGVDGSTSYNVTFGYNGDFAALPHGLFASTSFPGTINTGEVLEYDVEIPAGTKLARFSLFDSNLSAPADLDLVVYRGATQVGSSGTGTSEEEVNLVNPVAATYTVVVDGFDTGGAPVDFTLFTWAVTEADAGNLTVTAPATAVLGAGGEVTLAWAGLSADTKYLGQVTYHNVAAPAGYNDGRIGVTTVRVDTDAAGLQAGQPGGDGGRRVRETN